MPPARSVPDPDPTGELSIEHAHPRLRVDEALLEGLVRHVVAHENGRLRTLTVVLADHETVLELNRAYLDHDYHTDVLSFSLADEDEPGLVDGEVYVDLDTAAERHDEFGSSFEEEACRYVVHGLLHLLGYDDATGEGKSAMHLLEDRYLAAARQGFQSGL